MSVRRPLSAAGALATATAIQSLAALVLSLLVIRILDPAEYGTFLLGSLLAQQIALAGWIQWQPAVIQYRPAENLPRALDAAMTGAAANLGAIVLATAGFALILGERWAPVTLFAFLTFTFGGVVNALWLLAFVAGERDLRFGSQAAWAGGANMVSVACAFAALWLGAGVWSLVVREGVRAGILATVVPWRKLRMYRDRGREISEIVRFSIWRHIIKVLEALFLRGGVLLAGYLGTSALLGAFGAAFNLSLQALNPVTAVLGRVGLAAYSRESSARHHPLRTHAVLGLIAVAVVLIPKPLLAESVRWVLGDGWRDTGVILGELKYFIAALPLIVHAGAWFLAEGLVIQAVVPWALGIVVLGAGWAAQGSGVTGVGLAQAYGLAGGSIVAGYALRAIRPLGPASAVTLGLSAAPILVGALVSLR